MNDVLAIDTENDFYRELILADRCDRCGESSQAFARAVKVINGKSMELFFCGHHFAENEPSLVAQEFYIQDERHKINAKPASGAPESMIEVDDDML